MEWQQFEALHFRHLRGCAKTLIHYWTIGHLFRPKCFRRHRNYAINMSVTGASTNVSLPASKIIGLCVSCYPQWFNRQSLWVTMLATTWLLCPKMSVNVLSTERQRFLILHLWYSKGNGTQLTHNPPIGHLYLQKCAPRCYVCLLQLSAHGASTLLVEVHQATHQWSALCCF